MTHQTYTPYCGNDNCRFGMPRTEWNMTLSQFTCRCGWVSNFPSDFIARYKAKWPNRVQSTNH